jgi:hypothetical protein
LTWLSGAQADILANFKHDRPKYVGTGSAVLFTSVIAASSMAFAAQTRDYNAFVCQKYGRPGNCPAGNGPAATADWNRYQADTANIKSDNGRIAAEETTLDSNNTANKGKAVGSATTNLQHAQAQLTSDTNALNQLKSDFNSTNTNNTGTLARLKALDELRMSDFSMLVAEFVLFLFFAAIELLPVIVKLLLNRGDETPYEQAVAADVVNLMREEYAQRARYLDAVRQEDQFVAQSRAIQAAYAKDVMPVVTKRMIAARLQVELDKIARWEQRAMAENGRLNRGWEPAGLPRLKNGGRELGPSLAGWLRRRPARPAPAPRVATTGPLRRAIHSGPLPKIPDPYAATLPQRP